jgi:hypothetical protein
LDVAPQKPLRADEPVTQIDELSLRRVTTSNPAGAAEIETRVRFWCSLIAPRRLQLVFTRSSGRDSLCVVAAIDVSAIEDGLLWVRCSITGLGANPS